VGIYENTLIFFSSDNGPSGFYTPYFESAAPFRTESGYIKGSLHEGGIRVPLIATWPGVIKPGSISDHICALYDVFPTIADLTGFEATDTLSGISFLPELKGQEQKVHDFLYWEFPQPHENLFWKFPPVDGQMAVRIGKYKALRKAMHQGNMKWALYNLEEDPKELVDISSLHPEIISRVEEIIKSEHTLSENELWRFRVLGEK
jgi:arylsulfatase